MASVCIPLLNCLDPRETISPLQTLAVATVIRATHTLHCHVPDDVSPSCSHYRLFISFRSNKWKWM